MSTPRPSKYPKQIVNHIEDYKITQVTESLRALGWSLQLWIRMLPGKVLNPLNQLRNSS